MGLRGGTVSKIIEVLDNEVENGWEMSIPKRLVVMVWLVLILVASFFITDENLGKVDSVAATLTKKLVGKRYQNGD